MIKNLLFILCLTLSTFGSLAQCVDDYDWGDDTFGISPDPENGESLMTGVLNEPYSQTIYLLIPASASDVDASFPSIPLDSAELVSITIMQDGNMFTPEEFGLSLTCNNGGSSSNSCTFIGGQSGCGLLSGTPLLPGQFTISINAFIYASLAGQVLELPFDYDGYSITIDQVGSTLEQEKEVTELRISPNPFASKALLQFESSNAGNGQFTIMNLLGEVKYDEAFDVKRGFNKLQINSNDLSSGIYLYHLEVGGFNVTKRLVVNK
ncbi:MAG: T9SS type A sorting domain-containing protein [Flavobacteriales bacterium]